jgi:peptidyl-prolyl cis-trans isomerase C
MMLLRAATAVILGSLALTSALAAQEQGAQAPAAAPEQAPTEDPVVAIVDGAKIHLSEVEQAQSVLPDQYRQVPLPMIFQPLLSRVIDARLLAAEADRAELDQEPEVQPALAEARAQVLRGALIQRRVQEGTTEEKLRARYDDMKEAEGFRKEEVHARHILVPTEEEAKKIVEQVEGGADFAQLAAEHSTGPSAESGGDLGYFTREQMVPEFADAAFGLEPDQVTPEPVKTQFGWHVIKVLDKRTREPSFEETEPQLRDQLAREIVTALVTDLRGNAQIEQFNIDGSPMPAGGAQPGQGGGQQQPSQQPQQ